MSPPYLADDAIDSSDEEHPKFLLTNGLYPQRSRTATLPPADKPNVWKRCPLPAKGDQIRLLKLYPPGKRSDNNLEANLVVRKYNEPYEALSYTWGSEGDTGSIRVWSGSGEFEEIEIQANLEAALRQLRRKNRTRTLWADAICIDSDRSSTKHVRNLRIKSQLCEVFYAACWRAGPGKSYPVFTKRFKPGVSCSWSR